MLEVSLSSPVVRMALAGDAQPQEIPCSAPREGGFLLDFIADVRGVSVAGGLDTRAIIAASRGTLMIQEWADRADG